MGSRCRFAVAGWGALGAVRALEMGARVPGGRGTSTSPGEERVSGSRSSVCYPLGLNPGRNCRAWLLWGVENQKPEDKTFQTETLGF